MKNNFHSRSFFSFILFITILWLLVSGTVLYVAPPGRVAHWQHWTLFGFSKDQWQAQHTIFSYLFIIASGFHVFSLNWRNLWSYVKLKSKSGFRKQREFALAMLLIFIVFFGTSFDLPPFSSFFELGDTIGFSWEEKRNKAPMPHTELLSISEIASNQLHLEIEDVLKKLEANGISVLNASQTLKEIAIENGKSPSDIYAILAPKSGQKSGKGNSEKGYGKLTLEEVAEDLSIDVIEIISRLQSNNIKAESGQTIKDIASKYEFHPSEIATMIRGTEH